MVAHDGGTLEPFAASSQADSRPVAVQHPTPEESLAEGKAARQRVPRESHAEWQPAVNRPDPLLLLEEQGKTRVSELLPIR